ncbi:ZIP family metal transporter [Halocalculus aciditolerans]|uniref:ZIP family metal transporter n=1 Tax=Halocalculus aciditolerans TaxID=1383812 RepID=A0A830FFY4_9EURY|nr:hypothetical protein [Halocalculus aciditolerans]GGL51150.1 hypothetical protein GCM10009039_06750 [Halocalculus aciditolerans]
MTLRTVTVFAVAAVLPLVIGAALALRWRPPLRVRAELLAFASGALLVGLAFELFEPAVAVLGPLPVFVALLAGTALLVAVKSALGREDHTGLALLAGVLADGVAENLALGVALIGPAAGATPLLAGIAANNLPEALGGASAMHDAGWPARRVLLVWTATATALAAATVAGYAALADLGPLPLAVVRAFGAGAVLATLAVEIMPDAYETGGPTVAFATALGFFLAFALT